MVSARALKIAIVAALLPALAGCGGFGGFGKVTDPATTPRNTEQANREVDRFGEPISGTPNTRGQTLLSALQKKDTDLNVAVNRYIWNASLDVLNFMPVQSIDPFTGVIVFGYGTPPGGGRAYRATVHVKDPALDARSLTVALQSKGGPVAEGTRRSVEDAILARARQMRMADRRF